MSMKNFNDTIGNRTCDLPASSAVPQPTAPPRAPLRKGSVCGMLVAVKGVLVNVGGSEGSPCECW